MHVYNTLNVSFSCREGDQISMTAEGSKRIASMDCTESARFGQNVTKPDISAITRHTKEGHFPPSRPFEGTVLPPQNATVLARNLKISNPDSDTVNASEE